MSIKHNPNMYYVSIRTRHNPMGYMDSEWVTLDCALFRANTILETWPKRRNAGKSGWVDVYIRKGDHSWSDEGLIFYNRWHPKKREDKKVERKERVRVRFAPSPTGAMHVGGARTALFNYLFAYGEMKRLGKHAEFILRIEDTDQSRLVPGAMHGIQTVLKWFGLEWDEGPNTPEAHHGPYVQSQRLDLYKKYAEKLIESYNAYRCFCTPEELKERRERDKFTGYDGRCRYRPKSEVDRLLATEQPYVIRFRMPNEGKTVVNDILRGEITFENHTLEDLVLLKTDGFPTYHLANVVDDHFMGITHILRGEEWIPSAPLHVRLYAAFDWAVPKICHMPLILAPGGGKLSKRHGATSMEEFEKQGYLPEALMNYLALLGWNPGGDEEIFSKQALLDKFELARVNPAPATFDYKKLEWFNQQYINHVLDEHELLDRLVPWLYNAGHVGAHISPYEREFLTDVVMLFKSRLKTLAEAPDLMAPFLTNEALDYESSLLIPKNMTAQETYDVINDVYDVLMTLDIKDFKYTPRVEEVLRAYVETSSLKIGQIFHAVRVALVGRTEAPSMFETIAVLGRRATLARLDDAVVNLRELRALQSEVTV